MDLWLNLEPVSVAHQLRNLRRIYDSVETHVHSLKSLGIDSKDLWYSTELYSPKQASRSTKTNLEPDDQ